MNLSYWFDDSPVIGKMSAEHVVSKLREIGEEEDALAIEIAYREQLRERASFPILVEWSESGGKPWQHTGHSFGYIAPSSPNTKKLPIQHASNIAPDITLKNSRIKITLDRLRVAKYPGRGTHRVLFDFYAQNQVPGKAEDIHFTLTCRAYDGEQAAIVGYPIFVGLNVGIEGVTFKCYTVNVQNDEDEKLLAFLESDIFKSGLKLISTAQPAIGPLSQMALGLTKTIVTRRKNVAVQEFYMGLDFSAIPSRARLAEGSYIAVQIPETKHVIWNWDEWQFDLSNGHVVNKDRPIELIPYNYLVFSVSRYEGE